MAVWWAREIPTPRQFRRFGTSTRLSERPGKRAGRAHGEFFREVRPAATMVEVSRLIAPDMLVEIEADAVMP